MTACLWLSITVTPLLLFPLSFPFPLSFLWILVIAQLLGASVGCFLPVGPVLAVFFLWDSKVDLVCLRLLCVVFTDNCVLAGIVEWVLVIIDAQCWLLIIIIIQKRKKFETETHVWMFCTHVSENGCGRGWEWVRSQVESWACHVTGYVGALMV